MEKGPKNKTNFAITIRGKCITERDWPVLEHMTPEQLKVYAYLVNNNDLNLSTHIDNINFPKGFGFTRKDNFIVGLCKLRLIKDDGDDRYTIIDNSI